jgi:gamma-glutamyltranspeptidase/glutathione hydrolase
MSGIDGNGFQTIYWAPENKVYALGMTGAAPYAVDPNWTKDELSTGYKAGCVPGNFGGYISSLQKFGTMSLKEVFESAINYADNGVPLTTKFRDAITGSKTEFELFPSSARVFLPNGKVPEVGEMFYMKDLANTFKKLVAAEQDALKQGKSRVEALQAAFDRFYTGDIAQEMADFYAQHGGTFTLKDFADYKPIWKEPLHINYRGYDVYIPDSTTRSGYEVTMWANLIEGFDLQKIGWGTADFYHLITECMKVGAADVYAYVADEKSVTIPKVGMLSKEYAAERRKLITMDKAMVYPGAGNPKNFQAKVSVPIASQISGEASYDNPMVGTTSFVVCDRFGNVVGCTPTHGGGWGTKVVVGNTGMTFNNGTRWGSIAPYADNVNCVKGGKIPLLGNSPTILMKDGKFFAEFGTPGGEGIGQNEFQVLVNIVDFGMDIQGAIEAAKLSISGNPDLYVPGAAITVSMTANIPAEVIKGMEAKGHKVSVSKSPNLGTMVGVICDPVYGTYTAGADPTSDAVAVSY